MTRTLGIATVVLMLLGSAAYAGRGRGHGGRKGGGNGGYVVRDHRGGSPGRHRNHHRKHVRVGNGRYMFPGGVVRVYKRPAIRARYYDARVRPALIVEAYDPVPGYIWVNGGWAWGGGEWVWSPGYWAVTDEPVVSGGISVSAGITIR